LDSEFTDTINTHTGENSELLSKTALESVVKEFMDTPTENAILSFKQKKN
jgi:hypothetical protein